MDKTQENLSNLSRDFTHLFGYPLSPEIESFFKQTNLNQETYLPKAIVLEKIQWLRNLLNSIETKEITGEPGTIRGFNSKLDNTPLNAFFQNLIRLGNIIEANPLIFPTSQNNVREVFNTISNDIYNSNIPKKVYVCQGK